MGAAAPLPRSAWLFTRARESVRLEAHQNADGVQLLVCGPGTRRETHAFADMLALLVRQAEIERELLQVGFCLQEFITERRRYPR